MSAVQVWAAIEDADVRAIAKFPSDVGKGHPGPRASRRGHRRSAAAEIVTQVSKAVEEWAGVAERHGLTPSEITAMAPAFTAHERNGS